MTTARSRNRSSGFYSVYSVFVIFGVGIDFSTVRSGQNASPWSHKFFIFKCVPTSQAGRREFEPRLPLHLFNNLERIENQALLRLLRFLSANG